VDLREKTDHLAAGNPLDLGDEVLPHRLLKGGSRLLDCREAAGVDQCSLDGRVDVLEEADDVVVAHHRPRPARTA
jgi:hypothetical protein